MKNKTFHKAGLDYSAEAVLYTGNFITVNKELLKNWWPVFV